MCCDETHRVVYWRPHNSTTEYVNVLNGGTWLGWTETFTNKGGIFDRNIRVYTAASNFPELRVGTEYNRSGALIYTDRNHVDIQNFKNGKATTLSLVHEDDVELSTILKLWLSDGQHYNIFGEHNKPTGSYKGNGGSVNNQEIFVGGTGKVLCITNDTNNTWAIVTQNGAMVSSSGNNAVVGIYKNNCYFNDGVLNISMGTTHTGGSAINAEGVVYTYQVL